MTTAQVSGEPPVLPVDKRTDGPGVSSYDTDAPAAPMYRLLAEMRSPVALRDLMILPVRTGYIGQDRQLDPATLPRSAAEVFPDIKVDEAFLPSPDGPIRCQTFRRADAAASQAMLLYVHGGGFTVGQSEDTAYITSRLAWENDLTVVSVNYRVAPEWPFPSGLTDCLEVLRWLRANGGELGGDPARIAVAGDSAGGNFSAVLPLMARDNGVTPPDAVIMLCPITDFFFEQHPSFERLAPLGIVYDTAFIGFIRGAYAPSYQTWSHPHVSPIKGDLKGYPPALMVSGTADPLLDDNRAFVAKLRAAGNAHVDHLVRDGMPHGYYFFPDMFPDGDIAFGAMLTFLKTHLGPRV